MKRTVPYMNGRGFFAHFERLHFNYCIIAKGVD